MYCFDYDAKSYPKGALLANAKIHEVAEFYVMPHLKAIAATKFLLAMENPTKWNLNDFIAAVTVFYAVPNIDATVKNAVILAIVDNYKLLARDTDFQDLFSKTPEPGKDLALAMLPSFGKIAQSYGTQGQPIPVP